MKRRFILLTLAVLLFGTANAQSAYIHPWMQKRVAYFGDSITDPRNSGSKKKYWHFLQEWLGIEPYVYAVSGRQWDDIPRQADKLQAEHGNNVDAILIFIGTNDYNNGVKIGDSIRYADEKPEVGEQPLLGKLTLQPNMTKLYFGAWTKQVETNAADDWMGYYPGALDEFRLFNKALSEAEMLALYKAEVAAID